MSTSKYSRYFLKEVKCCSANTSVGAINAACLLFFIVAVTAAAATIVFPEPTSPCNNLFIGEVFFMSLYISSIHFF